MKGKGGKKRANKNFTCNKKFIRKKGKNYKKYMIFGLRVRGYVLNYKKYMIMSQIHLDLKLKKQMLPQFGIDVEGGVKSDFKLIKNQLRYLITEN